MRTMLLTLLAAILLVPSHAPAEGGTLMRLVTINSSSPRVQGTGPYVQDERPGWQVEMFREAASEVGARIQFRRMPWKEALHAVRTGQADAAFNSSYKPERDEYGAYPMKDGKPDESRASHRYAYWLYTFDGIGVDWDGTSITGLVNPVVADEGSAVVSWLKKRNIPVVEVLGYEMALDLLMVGKADAVAGFGSYVDVIIGEHPEEYEGVVRLTEPLVRKSGYLMFSQAFYDANTGLCERMWDAIGRLHGSEKYKSLRCCYRSGN